MWYRNSNNVLGESLEPFRDIYGEKVLARAWRPNKYVECDGKCLYNPHVTSRDFYYWYLPIGNKAFGALCGEMAVNHKDWLEKFLKSCLETEYPHEEVEEAELYIDWGILEEYVDTKEVLVS